MIPAEPPEGPAWSRDLGVLIVPGARTDLIEIYDFTEGKFGTYQADAYYAGLIRSLGLLADFPLIGQTVDDLAAGYRRFRFQSHLIFYTVRPDHVEIRAVVHGSQDIRPQLFE